MPPNTSLSRLSRPSICSSCRQTMAKGRAASMSSSTRLHADRKVPVLSTPSKEQNPQATPESSDDSFQAMKQMLDGLNISPSSENERRTLKNRTAGLMKEIESATDGLGIQAATAGAAPPKLRSVVHHPHHLHVYAHKHNTHMTLTRPNREPILSFSTGNLGFRKGQRGSFDAGFQLAAYVMRSITDKGLLRGNLAQFEEGNLDTSQRRRIEAPIRQLEIVLRGFGKGREAVTKALLGTEGTLLRDKVIAVSDDTKLKFGGTRSQNPRRL